MNPHIDVYLRGCFLGNSAVAFSSDRKQKTVITGECEREKRKQMQEALMAAEFGWCAHEYRMLFCEFKIVRKVEVLKSGTEVSCLGILKYNKDPKG